jgi:acylphosphatase
MTAVFSGNVQGVGFRYTTVNVARGFEVTGYVRNLSNGDVELVAEGEAAQVRGFVAAVVREMAGYISDTKSHEAPPTGQYSGFGIAR